MPEALSPNVCVCCAHIGESVSPVSEYILPVPPLDPVRQEAAALFVFVT